MYNRILIITGGEVDITSSQQYTGQKKYSKIIAVDGGLVHVKELGLVPDVIIGDFDTVSRELLESYESLGCETVRLNPMKDDTDTEAAFVRALSYAPAEIDILGAVGSRFDHTYANLFLLKRGLEAGVRVSIITALNRISLITGQVSLKKDNIYGKYISLLQFDGDALGVTLKGFVYEVENFDFDTKKTYRLGVSNELKEEQAYISIREGCMLLIESKEDKA